MAERDTLETATGADWSAFGAALDSETESPVATDAVDASTPPAADAAPATDEASTTAATRDDGRDEKGRFAPKGDAAADSPAPVTATASGSTGDTVPPITAPSAKAFRYRAAGDTHEFTGTEQREDGSVVFKPEAISQLKEKLGAGEQFLRQEWPRMQAMQAEVAQLREQRSVREAQAEASIAELMRVSSIADPRERAIAAIELIDGLPTRMQQAELAMLRAQVEGRAAQQAAPQQRQQAPALSVPETEQIVASVTETLETAKLDHAFAALGAEDWAALQQRLSRMARAFVRPVTPAEAQQYGLQPGQWAYDQSLVAAELQDAIASAEARKRATATASAQTRLAADNARRTQASITAPPVAAGGRKAPAVPEQSAKDYRDWKKGFLRGTTLE